MWKGYLEEEFNPRRHHIYKNWQKNYKWFYTHTSRHAYLEDFKKFVLTVNPTKVIPIHTEFKNEYKEYFDNVMQLNDHDNFKLNDIINVDSAIEIHHNNTNLRSLR
ncbi:MBL fold metallo-hydrolase RNA specificity domain-containing protein [candidate division KSB1 bacterium]